MAGSVTFVDALKRALAKGVVAPGDAVYIAAEQRPPPRNKNTPNPNTNPNTNTNTRPGGLVEEFARACAGAGLRPWTLPDAAALTLLLSVEAARAQRLRAARVVQRHVARQHARAVRRDFACLLLGVTGQGRSRGRRRVL